MTETQTAGMNAATARSLEYAIIGIGVVALVLIFQPFSLALFGLGCALVVLAGLVNNLLPLCQPGVPVGTIVKVAIIVAVLFFVVAGISIGSAYLYGIYLQSGQ